MATPITQGPANGNSVGGRRLTESHPSLSVSSIAKTHARGRRQLQQTSDNYMIISPVTIPLSSVTGQIMYFNYDSFTGTPVSADLTAFTFGLPGDDGLSAFTVTGSGTGANCVSNAANPDVACPASDSYSFKLSFTGPDQNADEDYEFSLSFTPTAAGPYQAVAETYELTNTSPFSINYAGSGATGRRLLQVCSLPWLLMLRLARSAPTAGVVPA